MTKRDRARRDVRRALKAQGRNQKWLAAQVGIKTSTLSDILHGRHNPSLSVAVAIERLTTVPVERFVGGA